MDEDDVDLHPFMMINPRGSNAGLQAAPKVLHLSDSTGKVGRQIGIKLLVETFFYTDSSLLHDPPSTMSFLIIFIFPSISPSQVPFPT